MMGELMVGVARRNITPPVGASMAGYAGRDHGAEGVRDELWVRAIFLCDGENCAALVCRDVLDTDNAEIDLQHEQMTWRELELHLRQGDPIPMGPEGEFLYSAHVSPESEFAGERIRDLPLVSSEVLIASIMRDGHHITPRGDTVIRPGDLLMMIANEEEVDPLMKYVDVVRYNPESDTEES